MFQTIADNITSIVAGIVLIGGFVWGIWKYGKKNVQEETKLKSRVDTLEKNFEKEIKEAGKHHLALYTKLGDLGKDVAFIRGKLE